MSNINQNDLKRAQLIMLEILIEVDKICQKYDIKYWLDSGTLLGAIRHKGFIPWDDDLDISMTLSDYNKYIELLPKELVSGMSLQVADLDKTFPYDFAKIRNNRGKIIEKHEINKNIKYNQGIFIDILPVINIQKGFYYKYKYKIVFLLIKLFSYKYLNSHKIRNFFIKMNDMQNNKNNPIMIRSGKFPSPLLYIKKEEVFPLKKTTFEGYEFFIPNNSDEYLKILYGDDYMTLPPKNKRHTHADSIEIYESTK